MKMGNDSISTILFAVAMFCAGFSIYGWINFISKDNSNQICYNESKKVEMVTKKPKEIYEIYDLEKLIEHVEKMNINKYHKERILKVIEFEKKVMEMSVYRDLGRERYLELIKEI